jgi:hypothetical protein
VWGRRFMTLSAAAVGTLTTHLSATVELGAGRTPYCERLSFETAAQVFRPTATPGTGSSRSTLRDLHGKISPSELHFARHHAGVPSFGPQNHRLLVHGHVERSLAFSMEGVEVTGLYPFTRGTNIPNARFDARQFSAQAGTTKTRPVIASSYGYAYNTYITRILRRAVNLRFPLCPFSGGYG